MTKHKISDYSVDVTELELLVEPETGDVFCIMEFEEDPTIIVRMNRFRFKNFQRQGKEALEKMLH